MATPAPRTSSKPAEDSPRPLAGRHAVVTGGSRGIGAAIAQELARLGADISLIARKPGRALRNRAVASRLAGTRVRDIVADITDETDAARALAQRRRGPRRAFHPRQQCRRRRERAFRQDRSGAVASHDRAQPHRRLSLHARGGAGDDRGGVGPHRQRRIHGRPQGLRLCQRLCRGEARPGRPDPRARGRIRAHRRHRECRVPRLHRHADAGRRHREDRREDEAQRRRRARQPRRKQSDGPADHAGGGRRRGRLSVPARGRLRSPARRWPSTAARRRDGQRKRHRRRDRPRERAGARRQARAARVAAAAHLLQPDRGARCAPACAAISRSPCRASTCWPSSTAPPTG